MSFTSVTRAPIPAILMQLSRIVTLSTIYRETRFLETSLREVIREVSTYVRNECRYIQMDTRKTSPQVLLLPCMFLRSCTESDDNGLFLVKLKKKDIQ